MDISVVVPCYNHEPYIEQCLQSVINQSNKPKEIIFIDDGSQDNSYAQAKKILQDVGDIHIHIEKQDNIGANNTINKGIQLSKSEYVTVINSDDVYDRDRFLRISEIVPAGFEWAFTKVNFICDSTSRDNKVVEIIKDAQGSVFDFPSIGFALLQFNVAVTTGNLIFKRTFINKLGGYRDLKLCHDWDLSLRALIYAEPYYVDEELYNYRLHGSNTFKSVEDLGVSDTDIALGTYFSDMNLDYADRNFKRPSDLIWGEYMRYFSNKYAFGKHYGFERI